jgi:acetyl esterase/lipase
VRSNPFGTRLDPELVEPLESMERLGFHARTLEELIGQRTAAVGMYDTLLGSPPSDGSIARLDLVAPAAAGHPAVPVRLYRPTDRRGPLPCIYWIHGGGLVVGSVAQDDRHCERYVRDVGCAVVSVEYRLAPEHPYPAAIDDCYAGLSWLAEHARELGIDPRRIAIAGSSAGGGLAAATALVARDRGSPRLAFQLLVRPMLDDRNQTSSSREFTAIPGWSREMNAAGWSAYLGAAAGSDSVSPYAAPARADDLAGLPPTMIQVGELEVFRDESIDYARRLLDAGVSTELHVYPGVFHGWDGMVPDATVSRRSIAERMAALRAHLATAPGDGAT